MSCHTNEEVMSHAKMWHIYTYRNPVALMKESQIYVWHNFFIRVTWFCIRVTGFMHICVMTHSSVWQISCICAIWPMHMCDMTHVYVRQGSFIRGTWLVHTCDTARSYVRRRHGHDPKTNMQYAYINMYVSYVCICIYTHTIYPLRRHITLYIHFMHIYICMYT